MKNIKTHVQRISRSWFPLWSQKRFLRRVARTNPYHDEKTYGSYTGESSVSLGIFKEAAGYHKHYICACRQLGISYRLLDISGPDWVDVVRNSGCDGFLVWPSAVNSNLRRMYDERLKVMVDNLKLIIFPTYDELWMWESKRRMRDWLAANGVPHPRTWVFYHYEEAKEFAVRAEYPLIHKPDFGDCAKGIKVLKSPDEAYKIIKRVFSKGIRLPGGYRGDIQWGNVVFQEFLTDMEEWRMAKVGESFFGYIKLPMGDFASGSGMFRHERPSDAILDFTREVCRKGRFESMNVDVFSLSDGRFLVNELQSVFGSSHAKEFCIVDGKPGRMVYDESERKWSFEAGSFCDNHFCNLRVRYFVEFLTKGRVERNENSKMNNRDRLG